MIAPFLKKAWCHVVLCSQLGLKEFPVEKRWKGIYDQFLEFIHSGCKEEMEESFTGFHIQTSKELRKSQEYLFCQRYEYCMPSLQRRSHLCRQNNSFCSINPPVSHLQSQLRFGLHGFPSSPVHIFRGTEDVSWKTEDILEELVQHHELGSLQSYLEKVRYKEVCPLNTDRSRSNFCVLI